MTDLVSGDVQTSEVQVQSAPAPASPAPPPERTYKPSEVTEIVKKERREAEDRVLRLQREQPDYFKQKYGESAIPNPTQSHSLTEDQFRKLAADEVQKQRDEWMKAAEQKKMEEQVGKIAQEFSTRIANGPSKYSDYEQVVGSIPFDKFPNSVQLSTMIDNTDDVWHELGNNPEKLALIEDLANKSPQLGLKAIQKLSDSIKQNQRGSAIQQPKEPIRQIRPSNTGTDSGVLTVSDYRAKYRG